MISHQGQKFGKHKISLVLAKQQLEIVDLLANTFGPFPDVLEVEAVNVPRDHGQLGRGLGSQRAVIQAVLYTF